MQLLEFLLSEYKALSRNKLKSLLTKGAVRVDGIVQTRYNFSVNSNNIVELLKGENANAIQNAERNMRRFAHIVYEDKWIIIVDKNVDILSVPSGHHGFCLKTLLDEYFQRKGEHCTAHIVHRLDKETSGLIIYAKNRQIQQTFTDNWREIIKDRRYYAVCHGMLQKNSDTIQSWLQDDKFYYTHSSPINNGGKLAITHYNLLKKNPKYSLLDIKLETGRKNQIRVHLQQIGFPIIGDHKYGNSEDPIKRLGLHAYLLSFTHPVTGKVFEFETPLPDAFKELF